MKKGINFDSIINGGGQEKGKRSGTENVAGIVGLGKACEIAKKQMDNHMARLKELRDYFVEQVEENIPNAKLNGSRENRLPGNANFSFENSDSQELLFKLDSKGICVSSGSACSSGNSNPSHVLTAIGLEKKLAQGTIRFTFGEDNTKEDIDYLLENLKEFIFLS